MDMKVFEFANNNNHAENDVLSIDCSNGNVRPKIIWKPTGETIFMKVLGEDAKYVIDGNALGLPWNYVANPYRTRYAESEKIQSFEWVPVGEDIIVVPVYSYGPRFDRIMPLVRDENGIYNQKFGFPLGYGVVDPRRNTGFGFWYDGTIQFDMNNKKSVTYGKVASNLYIPIKNEKSDISRVQNYYAQLEEWVRGNKQK